MGMFTKKRCRHCGQFAGLWHHCAPPVGITSPTPQPPLPPIPTGNPAIDDELRLYHQWTRYAQQERTISPGDITITFWDRRRGNRGRRITIPMPVSLDDGLRDIFQHGQCHALALALADRGYQIVGVVSKHTLDAYRPAKTKHYFALDPNTPGHGIDSYGSRPISEILARYPRDSITYPVTDLTAAIRDAVADGSYLEPSIDAGRLAAGWLLTELDPSR